MGFNYWPRFWYLWFRCGWKRDLLHLSLKGYRRWLSRFLRDLFWWKRNIHKDVVRNLCLLLFIILNINIFLIRGISTVSGCGTKFAQTGNWTTTVTWQFVVGTPLMISQRICGICKLKQFHHQDPALTTHLSVYDWIECTRPNVTTFQHFPVDPPFHFINQVVQTCLDIEVEFVIACMWKFHI